MSDTFSNVGGNSYFADLGITTKPMRVQHGSFWRPASYLRHIPVVTIPRGMSGLGVRTMADFSAAVAFSENTAMTDQAMPTITSTNPTLVGRGFSYSQSVQGRQRVADADWPAVEKIRDQKVRRVLVDDMTHLSGNSNSIAALSASITDITRDAAGNASLDGLFDACEAVGYPAVAHYDLVGFRGIQDGIRAEGHLYANQGVSDQVRRMMDKFEPDMIADDGFIVEINKCRIYLTNDRSGDATHLYETGGVTHALVMRDFTRSMDAGRQGNSLYQFEDVAAPIILMGRADPVPGLPAVHDVQQFLKIEDPALADALGIDPGERVIVFASWLDIGNNVAGFKRDFGGEYDPILANANYARCHQYLTTYQS